MAVFLNQTSNFLLKVKLKDKQKILGRIRMFSIAKILPLPNIAKSAQQPTDNNNDIFYFHNGCSQSTIEEVLNTFKVFPNFITEQEELLLLKEVEPRLKRLKYEYNHFDDAIHGFREIEVNRWSNSTAMILDRVNHTSFRDGTRILPQVHVLDLDKDGVIKPHIDSIRFCGNTVAGLCLLSNAVMRLVHEENKDQVVDILLLRRMLYYMTGISRFHFTHEVLHDKESIFGAKIIPRDRRISIMYRNSPDATE